MTIRELLAEESPTLRRRLAPFFPACRMKHRPVRSPAPPERWWCGRTPPAAASMCWWRAGPTPPGSSRRPLPHLLRVRPPHPLRGVRGPVRGKLLSGRGACQNRLPVLGARPGGLLLLVLLRPDTTLSRVREVVRSLWEQARRERGYLSLDSDSRLLSFLVSWYEANAGGGTACIPMTRPAIGDETGVCSRTVNRGVRALPGAGIPRHPERKNSAQPSPIPPAPRGAGAAPGRRPGHTLMEGFSCFIPTAPLPP